MYELLRLTDSWKIKLIASTVLTVFSPINTAMIVLFAMIFIDTFTGVIYALRVNKFSSKGLRHGLEKLLTYFVTILVVRLLEIGLSELFKTSLLTILVISYLVITEAASILENLTLLNAPLPPVLKNIILKQISMCLSKYGIPEEDKDQYIKQIENIRKFQMLNLKKEEVRGLMDIFLKNWVKLLNKVSLQLSDDEIFDNADILYFKVTTLINEQKAIVTEEWEKRKISAKAIEKFLNDSSNEFKELDEEVKVICSGNEEFAKKKVKITQSLVTLIYKVYYEQQGDGFKA